MDLRGLPAAVRGPQPPVVQLAAGFCTAHIMLACLQALHSTMLAEGPAVRSCIILFNIAVIYAHIAFTGERMNHDCHCPR